MSTTLQPKGDTERQAGMVAIMVTLILMIVISLIVLGFAQISRRNQRQALDRQLSTQAFYAAETGVNDVAERIKEAIANGDAIVEKPNCSPDPGGFYTSLITSAVIDDDADVEYTCIMVNPTPASLVYSSVGTTGTVVPLISAGGNIASIRLTWQSKDGLASPEANCPAGTGNVFAPATLPAPPGWNCGYGVLRFDLTETAGAALSFDSLRNRTMTSFIIPLRPGGTATTNPVNFSPGGANNKLGTRCNNTQCSYVINFPTPLSQYYLRVNSIYKNVSLQITAHDAINAGGNALRLQGAQAVIDSTGKAEDILRRIQVRIPTTASSANLLSDYALQSSEAICKRFSVMDGFFDSTAGDVVSGLAAAWPNNQLCQ